MTDLNRKAILSLLRLLPVVAALLFLPAWTLDYWQAWLFMVVLFSCALAITLYLMKYDRQLLERRMRAGPRAEKEASQKKIMRGAVAVILALPVLCALDHRFGSSDLPAAMAWAGECLVALGFLITFLVFRENSYAAGVIEHAPDQKVIATGPYALVRHPMYFGALILLAGVPPALGSVWAMLLLIVIVPGLALRITEEEKFLMHHLPGYSEYRREVRYRLVPFVW